MRYYEQASLRHMGDVPSVGARRYGDKTAIVHRREEQSHVELNAQSNRLANALVASGIESSKRVGIYKENNLEWMAALFGVIKSGAVAVPLDFRRAVSETAYIPANTGIDTIIGSSPFIEVFEHLREDGSISGLRCRDRQRTRIHRAATTAVGAPALIFELV